MDSADYQEITALKARYFRYVDSKQWARLRELFTDDASFEGLWAAAPTPDAFIVNLTRNMTDLVSIHHGYLPELRSLSPDHARGLWAMTDYLLWEPDTHAYLGKALPGQRGIKGYGHYEEEYRRDPTGTWRISFLRLTRQRIEPIVGPPAPELDFPFRQLSRDWME
jgi:hypothetical protein